METSETTAPHSDSEKPQALATTAAEDVERQTSDEVKPHEESEYPSGIKFWSIILVIGAVLIKGSLDVNIVGTAVPSITDEFHTVADVGWYSAGFRMCACAFQFIYGKAYKIFSVKKVFLFANALSFCGSLLCATAVSSPMLIAGRCLAGTGYAGLLSGCFQIVVHTMPLRRRPLFVGALAGVENIATISAPLLGGVLTEYLSWRWCFYINLPFGAITILFTIAFLSITDTTKSSAAEHVSTRQKLAQLDLISTVFLLSAMTPLFMALTWGGSKFAWSSPTIIGLFCTSGILFIAFAYNQYRLGDGAVLPVRILQQRSVVAGFIFAILANSCVTALEYYLPTYYQVVQGYKAAASGYLLIPIIVGTGIATVFHGSCVSRFGYYTPFMLFASTIMPVATGLVSTFKVDTSIARVIVYTGFAGIANGIAFSAPQTAAQTVLPAGDASLGIAIILFAQSFGPSVAVEVAQVVLTSTLASKLEDIGLDSAVVSTQGLQSLIDSAPKAATQLIRAQVNDSLTHVWYLVVGMACATMIGSCLMQWRSVKQEDQK